MDHQSAAIVVREGGEVDDKTDRGGHTKYGVTIGFLKSLGKEGDIDGDGDVDDADISALQPADAQRLFARHFFIIPHFDLLPDSIMPMMWDGSVHHGAGGITRILQRVINKAGFGPIDVDGGCGPRTRACAWQAHTEMGPFFVNAMVDERKNFMLEIIANDPSQVIYKNGWLKRAESFRVKAS